MACFKERDDLVRQRREVISLPAFWPVWEGRSSVVLTVAKKCWAGKKAIEEMVHVMDDALCEQLPCKRQMLHGAVSVCRTSAVIILL